MQAFIPDRGSHTVLCRYILDGRQRRHVPELSFYLCCTPEETTQGRNENSPDIPQSNGSRSHWYLSMYSFSENCFYIAVRHTIMRGCKAD